MFKIYLFECNIRTATYFEYTVIIFNMVYDKW